MKNRIFIFAILFLLLTTRAWGQTYTITVNATNGSVVKDPDAASYASGTEVFLIPRPAVGYCFDEWTGDVANHNLVARVIVNGNKNVTAHFKSWVPPVGVPAPTFGITQTYRMYDDAATRAATGLTYYQNAEGGYYTSYVDNTGGGYPAEDSDDPASPHYYGTREHPRLTTREWTYYPAGSVVEIHGGPYEYGGLDSGFNTIWVSANGTAQYPVFIRGATGTTPEFHHMVARMRGTYIILENLDFNEGTIICNYQGTGDHVVVRMCEVRNGDPAQAGARILAAQGGWNNNVVYGCYIHHNGDRDYYTENDLHGIVVTTDARYAGLSYPTDIWAVDNHMAYGGGDGMQINSGGGPVETLARRIYVGRNVIHGTAEAGLAIKSSADVIVSQNTVFDYHPTNFLTSGSDGTGIVLEEDGPHENVWIFCNTVFWAYQGIRFMDGGNIFNNLTYNIHNAETSRGSGILGWAVPTGQSKVVNIFNNTVTDADRGFSYGGTGDCTINLANNVFAYRHAGSVYPSIYIERLPIAEAATFHNNLVYEADEAHTIVWGNNAITETLEEFQSRTGKGANCVATDPLFVDAASSNFCLQAASPAIDAGISLGVVQEVHDAFEQLYGIDICKDIEGRARPQGGAWDIGAYEYCVEAANDLAVSGVSQNSTTLGWTVPGEAGITGTPAQYDIRYAEGEITEANWGMATQVQGEPIPGNFGAQQSFTITGLNPGATYYIAMKVLDAVGHSSSLSNEVSGATTTTGNHAPVLSIPDESVNENNALNFTVAARDADNDPCTYSASGLPIGATFTAATRTFTWTPTDTQEGVYHVMFQVTDGQVTVWETITITVLSGSNHPPELTAIGNKTVNEGETLSFSVGATDVDPGQTVTYSVSGLPSGAAFVGQDFTWTPGYDQAGAYNVTFTASDGQAQDSEMITITVANVNRAPVLASVGSKQVNENFSLTFSVSATDPDGDSMNYSASGLPSGASFSSGTFSWTPSFTQAGTYVVTFVASDGSLSDTEQVTITVGNISDETAPAVVDLYPEPDAIQIPVNPLIVFAVSDAGLGVDANTVTIQVDGQLVYSGNQAESQSVYGICRRTGTKASYRYHYQPASRFDFDQRVSVSVTASDLANNVMDPCSYGFVTEMRSFGGNEAISPSGSAGGHSAMATDGQGDIWAVCHAGQEGLRDVYVLNRDGSTLSWGDPVRLTDLTSDQCNPVVAVAADDAIYVAWQDNRRGNWDIYVSSTADGVTWRDAVRVTDSNDNQTHPAISIDSDDPPRVCIAWEDDSAGNQNIWLASSNTSFAGSTIVQVTSNAADETEPALAAGLGNVVYAVWTDRRNGSADIYGAASNASWTNRPVVAGDGDQYSPAIAVEFGTSSLHVVWVDDAAGNPDVLYGSSTGLPASVFAGVLLVDDTTDAGQLAPAIVAASDSLGRQHVYACWQDSRASGDAPDTDLYFVEIRSGVAGTNILVGDDGANSDQSEPALGFDGDGQPVILWTDDRDVTPYIYGAGGSCFGPVLASASITSPSGGIVGPDPASIDDIADISIRIPANAYDCDAVYTIWQVHNLPLFASACLAACEIGPSGVEFLSPATITMPHATSSTGLAVPYWYDAQTGTLNQEGISNVANTTSANGIPVVSFQTTHLTSFYILEGTVSSGGDGGGGGGCSLPPGKSKKSEKTTPGTRSKTMPSTSNKVKLRSQIGPARGLSPSGQSGGSPKVAGMICRPEVVEYFIPYAALAGIMVGLRIRDARRHRK